MTGFLCGSAGCIPISEAEFEAMGQAIERERLKQPDGIIPDAGFDDSPFWRRVYRRYNGILAEVEARRAMEAEAKERREAFGLILPDAEP